MLLIHFQAAANMFIPPPDADAADANQGVIPMDPAAVAAAQMHRALVRLGLSPIAAHEFINNGIISTAKLRVLAQDDLDRLIKQIHRDNQGAGLFIPFMSQQYVHAVRFWTNRMHILGAPYDAELINLEMAEQWSEIMKQEAEAAKTPTDLLKLPEPFKRDTKWVRGKKA
jgi:hypothetical protein